MYHLLCQSPDLLCQSPDIDSQETSDDWTARDTRPISKVDLRTAQAEVRHLRSLLKQAERQTKKQAKKLVKVTRDGLQLSKVIKK